jgi:N-acyl-D-aspartate/D-glutamate deacylase
VWPSERWQRVVSPIREQLGEDGWTVLRTGLILMCRSVVGPENDWSLVEQRLGEISAARHRDDADLVSALLDDLSDPAVRHTAIERTRSMVMALPEIQIGRATMDAARLVDRACPEQSFAFRAGLTLISLWVTGNP